MSGSDKLDNLKKRTGKSQKQQSAIQDSDNIKNPEIEINNDELEVLNNSLKIELNDWKERATRLSAEISNLQKQHEIDIAGAKKSGKKTVSSQLLIFLNTLNLAFSFAPKTDDTKVNSFISTLKASFEKVLIDLKSSGVEIISPEPGQDFNPETMAVLDVAPEAESNPKVSRIAGLGYKVDGQIIQPASVLLA